MNSNLKTAFYAFIASDYSSFEWVETFAPEGLIIYNPKSHDYWFNQCFKRNVKEELDLKLFFEAIENCKTALKCNSLNEGTYQLPIQSNTGDHLSVEVEVKNVVDQANEYHIVGIKAVDNLNSEIKIKNVDILQLDNQYQNILQHASIGIAIHDERNTYFVNDYLCEFLGTSRQDLMHGNIIRFINDEFVQQSKEKLNALLNEENQTTHNTDIKVKTKNGDDKYAMTKGIKAKYNNRDVVISYIFDTTQLVETQNSLSLTKEHFENIANSVPGMVLQYILNPDGTDGANFIGKGVKDVYGISSEEAMADTNKLWNNIIPKYVSQLRQSIKESADNLTEWRETWQIKRPDGQIRWVKSRGIPKKGKNGITYWDTLIWDVTEVKNLASNLKKTTDMLEQAGRLAKVGGWYFDLRNNDLEWTKITKEIHEVDEHYRPNLEDAIAFYLPGESTELIVKAVNDAKIHKKPYQIDVQIVTAKGNLKWVRTIGTPRIVKGECVELFGSFQDITEQKENELLLEEQKSQLESINENINEGIYRANINGLIYANKAFLRMFGFKDIDEAIENFSSNLYQDPSLRNTLIATIFEKGLVENQEVNFNKKDGTILVGLINARKFEDDRGQVFWDAAIRDISEEKIANKKIKENERLLESINENINDAIYRSEYSKGLIYVNDAFVKMFGYDSNSEIIDSEAIKLYRYKEDRKKLGDMLVDLGRCDNEEVEFMRKDGSFFWGELNAIKIESEDGLIYFDGAIRDITAQKATQHRIEYLGQMKKILMTISSKYINIPFDEVEESINSSLAEIGEFVNADRAYIFDYDFDNELINNTYEWCAEGVNAEIGNLQNIAFENVSIFPQTHKTGKELIIPDVMAMEEGPDKDILLAQKIKSLIALPMMQGEKCVGFVGFDFNRNAHVFSDREQDLLRIFAEMLVNIQSRIQNQIDLNHLLNTTSSQNKRLKEFAYIISHNIRSSVANLLGLTKIILSEPNNDEYIRLLLKTSEKLDTSIKNINELLHFENDFSPASSKKCNIKKYILHNLQLHQQAIDKNEIKINIDVEANISIAAIPAYLDSIFHNLISNAIKYGITRSKKQIDFSCKETDQEIIISVRDYGWGLDLQKNKVKLFKLGSRLHDSSEGQGLGLYMTKHQVEAMSGTIDVQSELNQGTAFVLRFPKKNSAIELVDTSQIQEN